MTAELVDPLRTDAVERHDPPRPRAPGRRRIWWSCVLVPLVVLAPLSAQAPSADHRLNMYFFGSRYLTRPWELPAGVFEAVPYFLRLGNFRPLGRIYEWSLDVVVFAMTDLLGVPVNIGLRLLTGATAVLLTLTAVLVAESLLGRGRLLRAAPAAPIALLPFAVGAGFVAAGPMSTSVLFGPLYQGSAALVLAVTAWSCRAVGAARVGVLRGTLAVLCGAGLAAFNEMAYLAVPLATVAATARALLVLGLPPRAVLHDAGTRFAVLLWLGFLPVFLPVRAVIHHLCAAGGCYSGSDMALTAAPATLPNRLVAWLPPLMWQHAAPGPEGPLSGAMPVVALAVLLLPAWLVARSLPRLPAPTGREALALAVTGAAVILLGGALASLNDWVQAEAALGRWGVGWREGALTAAGGGLLVSSLLAVAAGRRRAAGAVAAAVLALTAAGSAGANKTYHDGGPAERFPYLHDRIAQEIADFDPTPAGNRRRCVLRAEYAATTPGDRPRIERILDHAAREIAGRRFCVPDGP